VRGLAASQDFVGDSDRIVVAESSFFWNTYGDTSTFVHATAFSEGVWKSWEGDSTRLQNYDRVGRAAEFWRPGWIFVTTSDPPGSTYYDTIVWISDNHVVFLATTLQSGIVQDSAAASVIPVMADPDADVEFVPVEVNGKPAFLALQAGMEPILYSGATASIDNMRYFGIADSGLISPLIQPGAGGITYIVDNAKLGIYGHNELADRGYWIHIPQSPASDTAGIDSSYSGHVYPIDSNSNVNVTGDIWQFRIWFTPSDSAKNNPGGNDADWTTATAGKRYQILSAPIARLVYDTSDTPVAYFEEGGRTAHMATGTIAAHEFDHVPHYIEILADTLDLIVVDSFIVCPDGVTCDTIVITRKATAPGPYSGSRFAINPIFPIRTSFLDTGVAPDSVVIWTSGLVAQPSYPTFNTNDWRIWKASVPYASDGAMYEERLYLAGDPQAPNLIAYSDKDIRGPLIGAFPDENLIQLPANGDEFTGFALIYTWLVIFQKNHTWILKGDPDESGVLELALPDEGCIAPKTIVELDNLVLYLSYKGWRVFDGNTASDFGAPIHPAVQAMPRVAYSVNQGYRHKSAAAYDPVTGNIWMCMPFGTDTANSGSFIYNARAQTFTYSDEVYGAHVEAFSFLDTNRLIFTNPDSSVMYQYGYTDSLATKGVDRDSMVLRWTSGWLDMEAPFTVKQVTEGAIMARVSSPVADTAATKFRKFVVSMYKDHDTTAFYADTTLTWGLVNSVHYEYEITRRLEPYRDLTWLKIDIQGFGLNVMEVQRIALRYRLGDDVLRDATQIVRP
jgi:hypothetical protein